jgi:hypothetical protein
MTMFELLNSNHNDLTDHDLAHLADWANDWVKNTPNPDWKKAYALIREGADLLLRRRAMSRVNLDNQVGQPIKSEPPIGFKCPDCNSDSRSQRLFVPRDKTIPRGCLTRMLFTPENSERCTHECHEIQAVVPVDYLDLRRQLNDFESTFYGPHPCSRGCDAICASPFIIRQSEEHGGAAFEWDPVDKKYVTHWHRKAEAIGDASCKVFTR